MRAALHTEIVNVRLPGVIFERARRRAARKGMTMSELVRCALRAELGDA